MITAAQFKTLDDLYDFYNRSLFEGKLSDCIVNMSRHAGSYGFFAARRWKEEGKKGGRTVHEISLNPDYLGRPFEEWHSTLVHEMVHLWQEDLGRPSRAAYHNREWARKMEQLGLIPSDTGKPGGKKTGQAVSHYIDGKGLFKRVFGSLKKKPLEELRLKYLPAYPRPEPSGKRRRDKDGERGRPSGEAEENTGGEGFGPKGGGGPEEKYTSKKKYSCPCGNNVWGRPALHILCGSCGGKFRES